MTEPTRFYSVVAPKNSARPYARQLIIGDEWHNEDVVKVWNGTEWADKELTKTADEIEKELAAYEAEEVQRELDEQKQREALEASEKKPVDPPAVDTPAATPEGLASKLEELASKPAVPVTESRPMTKKEIAAAQKDGK